MATKTLKKHKRYVIKSKLRFIFFLTLIFVSFTFAVNGYLGLGNSSSLTEIKHIEIEVMYGDSLWSIAQEYGKKDNDIRESVYQIASLNNIEGSEIYVGQKLTVPVYN